MTGSIVIAKASPRATVPERPRENRLLEVGGSSASSRRLDRAEDQAPCAAVRAECERATDKQTQTVVPTIRNRPFGFSLHDKHAWAVILDGLDTQSSRRTHLSKARTVPRKSFLSP